MEITQLSSDSDELVFTIDNITCQYINGLRRIILGEYPSYAVDHVNVVKNTSKINNDKLNTKLKMLPIDRPMAFSVSFENKGLVTVDVTTSDLTLYKVNSEKFQEYMEEAFTRKNNVTLSIRKKIVGNNYVVPIVANVEEYVCNEKVQKYIDELDEVDEDTDESEPQMMQDIHLISLEVGESIDLYGIAYPGTPHTNVKFQQANAFFRQCKKIVKNDLD
jgi:DNA-directed RNA polymerase alpha subunit